MISAFGLAVELGLAVPELEPGLGLRAEERPDGPVLRVELAAPQRLQAAWSGSAPVPGVARATVDGSLWTAERGRRGDVRMEHQLAGFHLDAGGHTLLCAPADVADPAWRRLLLDTALVTASLARGLDALHAGAVVMAGRAVAIAGPSGAGKTSLMLELLRAGAGFLTDDVLVLVPDGDAVLGYPGPPLANLPGAAAADAVAEPLHRIGQEWWSRIPRPHFAPAPVSTVVVLERGPSESPGPVVSALTEPVAPLLALALQGGPTAQRRERRLEVLAQLAQRVEVLGVTVTGRTPARELASQLIEAVPRLAP